MADDRKALEGETAGESRALEGGTDDGGGRPALPGFIEPSGNIPSSQRAADIFGSRALEPLEPGDVDLENAAFVLLGVVAALAVVLTLFGVV